MSFDSAESLTETRANENTTAHHPQTIHHSTPDVMGGKESDIAVANVNKTPEAKWRREKKSRGRRNRKNTDPCEEVRRNFNAALEEDNILIKVIISVLSFPWHSHAHE